MKILIAEDDPVARQLLTSWLPKWGYDIVVANDGEQAWKVLEPGDRPRLAILDWMMPKLDGAELCRRIRSRPDDPYVYLVLLTALSREEDIVRGMEAGADDYVVKPFRPYELRARLRAAERVLDLQARLVEASLRDPMTGLYCRRFLQEYTDKLVAAADRRGEQIAVVMFDLDHFKRVNDTHGHDGGDVVLKHVATVMRESVRAADIVVRVGGEEFLVVLLDANEADAIRVAEKVRARVESSPVALRDGSVAVTMSAGVSVFPTDANDFSACIKLADLALYRAKETGRNRTARFAATTASSDPRGALAQRA